MPVLKFFNEGSLPLGQARPTLLETPPPEEEEDPVLVLDGLGEADEGVLLLPLLLPFLLLFLLPFLLPFLLLL